MSVYLVVLPGTGDGLRLVTTDIARAEALAKIINGVVATVHVVRDYATGGADGAVSG